MKTLLQALLGLLLSALNANAQITNTICTFGAINSTAELQMNVWFLEDGRSYHINSVEYYGYDENRTKLERFWGTNGSAYSYTELPDNKISIVSRLQFGDTTGRDLYTLVSTNPPHFTRSGNSVSIYSAKSQSGNLNFSSRTAIGVSGKSTLGFVIGNRGGMVFNQGCW